MLTFQWELIFGASWVAQSGTVHADTPDKARAKIFETLGRDDLNPDKWVETPNTPARFQVYLTESTEGVGTERLEFWEVLTLFSEQIIETDH